MAADAFSSFLGMTLQGTGNNNNAWGTILNGSALQVAERAIAGNVGHAVTGGTLDLSTNAPPNGTTQALDFIQIFSGALTAKQIVVVPNVSKSWYIFNNTTGAFPLHLQAAGGTVVQIPQGTGKLVICDGATNLLRVDRDQVGCFVHSGAAATANPGTLPCDGTSYLKTDYPDLFAKISTTFGTVDSLHFSVPKLTDTGRFLRSITATLTLGTFQANQNLAHTHDGATFAGTTGFVSADHTHAGSGTTANDSPDHTHGYQLVQVAGGSGGEFGNAFSFPSNPATTGGANARHTHTYSFNTGGISANHTHTFSGVTGAIPTSGGTESRPEALAVYIGIAY